jgi:hypothetical protein
VVVNPAVDLDDSSLSARFAALDLRISESFFREHTAALGDGRRLEVGCTVRMSIASNKGRAVRLDATC